MVSAIDETQPANGELLNKGLMRDNFGAAKTEILALQAEVIAILGALQLTSGVNLFPVIAGDNLPTDPATLTTIIQTMDAAITAAAASGGAGGPITLAAITDILSPTAAQRVAFQNPIDGGSFDSDFNFDEGAHAGRWLVLDNAGDAVAMTLPAANTLARPDGWLCRVTAISSANFGSVIAPADTIRFQQGRFGVSVIATTVFLGASRATGIRALMDIYKDGSLYQFVGAGRTIESDDLSFGAAQSLNASALVNESLVAAAFPALLDLGGTKQAGGGRGIVQEITGTHTFLQANSGKTLEHTGGAAVTWNVPALLPGTAVEIDNATGGEITLNDTGSQTVLGGTTLQSGSAGAVKWLNDNRVRFFGTI